MPETLLRTKLFVPPLRPSHIARPRLTEQLNEALELGCCLVLLSAPAGSGKTMLLGEWVANSDLGCAWLSLDKADNDPLRFLTYLVAALQSIAPDIGAEILDELRAPGAVPGNRSSQIESALTILINDVTDLAGHFLLVLDDYHLIEAPVVHAAVSFLLEHQPPQMHLVIATRADPPLPIARLRGQGQLIEIHATELGFAPDETIVFLNEVMGLGLSAGQVAALDKRTEGWIAGLQLAALSLKGRGDAADFIQAFTGSHRFVLDYLTEEVLSRQPKDTQVFLKHTAILDRLSGSLCDAVTGREDSQEMLETLETANLFIVPLDEERLWYRYHHLFADLLRQHLQREYSDLQPQLRRRASDWYAENGQIPEAVDQALAAGDIERATELIENNAWSMLTRGEFTTLLNWLNALPGGLITSRQRMAVFYSWALTFSGQLDDAESYLAAIDDRSLWGEVLAMQSFIAGAREDIPRAVELGKLAFKELPPGELFLRGFLAFNLGVAYWRGGELARASRHMSEAVELGRSADQSYLTLMAMSILGHIQEMQGFLQQALETQREALKLIAEPDGRPVPFAGMAYVGLAEPLYERNALDDAVQYANEGIRLSELSGRMSYVLAGRLVVAKVHKARGDFRRAQETIRGGKSLAKRHDHAYVAAEIAELRLRLWLAQGNLAAASRWAEEHRSNLVDEPSATLAQEVEQTALAKALIACSPHRDSREQDGIVEAIRLLARLYDAMKAGGRGKSAIKILALRALAFQAQGDMDQALITLEQSLSQAESEGFVRTFVDEGEPMARLLSLAQRAGVKPGYIGKLLACFPEPTEPPVAGDYALVEPLSERELEVLRLIAAGLSNQEIAQELIIAVSTVKSHINHIYGKLGVTSRTHAVARAHKLGLLSIYD